MQFCRKFDLNEENLSRYLFDNGVLTLHVHILRNWWWHFQGCQEFGCTKCNAFCSITLTKIVGVDGRFFGVVKILVNTANSFVFIAPGVVFRGWFVWELIFGGWFGWIWEWFPTVYSMPIGPPTAALDISRPNDVVVVNDFACSKLALTSSFHRCITCLYRTDYGGARHFKIKWCGGGGSC